MITQDELKKLIDYREGKLYWRVNKGRIKAGTEAGGLHLGCNYRRVVINWKIYKTHLLVWIYHYGYIPENIVDHINRNTLDNRIENLREVSLQCNARNISISKNNKSSVMGIDWHVKASKWRASIKVNRKKYHIGYFSDFTEAVAHRLAAEQCLNWSSCNSNSTAYQHIQNYLKEI